MPEITNSDSCGISSISLKSLKEYYESPRSLPEGHGVQHKDRVVFIPNDTYPLLFSSNESVVAYGTVDGILRWLFSTADREPKFFVAFLSNYSYASFCRPHHRFVLKK